MPRRRMSSGDRRSVRSPSMTISPSLGRSSPLITRSTVDLPAPLGPTMHVTVRSAQLRSTPCRTLPPPYPAVTADKVSTSAHPSLDGLRDVRGLGGRPVGCLRAPVVTEVGVEDCRILA